jgi:hypothetical protein
MNGTPRRSGGRWRLLAHDVIPGGGYGAAHGITVPGTEFDELVVGKWIHVEQMSAGYWWMNVGGVTVHVRADRDGRPKHVMVHGPGEYDDPVEGCEYELVWRKDGAA